jgi:dTMP kinase
VTAGRGVWITLEGGDGSGKTTQAERLERWLSDQGRAVLRTREPGGSGVGQLIRDIVLHHRGDIAPRAEALLYAADRAHHVATIVRPALERGEIVLQDRYLDSSVAYQGAGRVLDGAEVRDLSLWATDGALPDLTVLLDLDPAAARKRRTRALPGTECRGIPRDDRRSDPPPRRVPPLNPRARLPAPLRDCIPRMSPRGVHGVSSAECSLAGGKALSVATVRLRA